MRFGCELYLHPIASFPFPGKRGHLLLWPLFLARRQLFAYSDVARLQGCKPSHRSLTAMLAFGAIQGATSILTYRKLDKPGLGRLGDSLDDMGPSA